MGTVKQRHLAQLFREALAINPNHEDSHYYLANCLVELGNIHSAIRELDALIRINPKNIVLISEKGNYSRHQLT